jgi:hypothetical protein
MFRVEFFCDDKKLADALRSLMGIAHGAPSVTPVVNEVRTGNGLAAASNGTNSERFFHMLKKVKGREVKAGEIKSLMKEAGLNPTSINHFIKSGQKAGLVTKHGKHANTTYKVL